MKDGHEWAEAETSRGLESRAGGVASKRIILVGTAVPHASSSPFQIVSCQGDPWQLGVTLTWRRCQGQVDWTSLAGNQCSMRDGRIACVWLVRDR